MNLFNCFFKLIFFFIITAMSFSDMSAKVVLPKEIVINVKNSRGSGTIAYPFIYDQMVNTVIDVAGLGVGDSKQFHLKPLRNYGVAIGVLFYGVLVFGVTCYYYITGNPLISRASLNIKSGGEFYPHITHSKNMIFTRKKRYYYDLMCPW